MCVCGSCDHVCVDHVAMCVCGSGDHVCGSCDHMCVDHVTMCVGHVTMCSTCLQSEEAVIVP